MKKSNAELQEIFKRMPIGLHTVIIEKEGKKILDLLSGFAMEHLQDEYKTQETMVRDAYAYAVEMEGKEIARDRADWENVYNMLVSRIEEEE
jgi:hypothetical protein